MKLSNVRLLVDDFDSCFKFYAETLGLKVTWGEAGDVYASFDTGANSYLAIFSRKLMLEHLGKTVTNNTNEIQHVICFETVSVDNDYKELKKSGVNFLNEPSDMTGWGIRCVHLTDPEGNIIELHQILPKDQWSPCLQESDPSNKE